MYSVPELTVDVTFRQTGHRDLIEARSSSRPEGPQR
jgi:hypothetical protein